MIPKRIIQIYQNHNLPLIYRIGQEIIKEKCNDYEYIFYTNRLMTIFINTYFPQYIDLYNSLIECNKNTLFILLELYKNGGIYLENDVILYKNFDEILENNCCILPFSKNNIIDKYCICANIRNKFIFHIILRISITYNNNSNFINNKIIYDLYKTYKENNSYKNKNKNQNENQNQNETQNENQNENLDIKIIYGEYNNCFGDFLYNIKINSETNNYPDWFKNNIYNITTKNKVKNILQNDIKWLDNITYSLL